MPDTLLQTAKPSLAYAKLVASPNDSSWSQVYNAGNLFACLSLTIKDYYTPTEDDEAVSLQLVGKEIFNILESEFFSLAEKNTETIKKAITVSIKNAPESVSVNLSLAVFKEDILYVFIAGAGKIIMKRGEAMDILLEQAVKEEPTITSASGYLKNKDTIVLETEQFAKDIADETVASALDLILPNDIAEALSPQIHEKDDGGQAAIVIVYHGIATANDDETIEEEIAQAPQNDLTALYKENDSREEENTEKETFSRKKKGFSAASLLSKLPTFHKPSLKHGSFNHRKRLFLSITIILLVLLATSIYLTTKKQEDDKRRALFQTIYTPAEKMYEEGKGIQSLNKGISRDNFLRAEKILKDGQKNIKQDTPEAHKLQELLAKVEAELGSTTTVKGLPAKEAEVEKNSLMDIEKTNADGLAFGQNDTTVYMITTKAVTTVSKANGSKKEIINNEGDWENPQAIVPYQGNIYILDRKKGIIKYTAGGDGFGKTSYFKTAPDLSKASGMTIDGSVWITNDQLLLKYTKGESDGFTAKGMDKPLSNPTKLSTTVEGANIYILDKGNSRVVKLTKDGSFQAQYPSDVIADAKDFEVIEADKKILILSKDKVWEISMQ